jgi:hypothetical protein
MRSLIIIDGRVRLVEVVLKVRGAGRLDPLHMMRG